MGYTNAGKSTLLNKLTGAGILAEEKLFATLDPTTRALTLPGGEKVLLTDKVGFIRKLPHHLVDAFKSTLEEAKYSDVILHVVDCSNPCMEQQMEAVYETLNQLGIKDTPVITAFNKIDQADKGILLKDVHADETVMISAKEGTGTGDLLNVIEDVLSRQKIYLEKKYGYDEAGKIQAIRNHGQLIKEEYRDDGIYVEAYIPKEILGMV